MVEIEVPSRQADGVRGQSPRRLLQSDFMVHAGATICTDEVVGLRYCWWYTTIAPILVFNKQGMFVHKMLEGWLEASLF